MVFLLAVLCEALLLLCSAGSALELNPNIRQISLDTNSSLSITCSGWAPVNWRFKREENVPAFRTETRTNTTSVLHLEHVTWEHTGVYVCSEDETNTEIELAIYVPGEKHSYTKLATKLVPEK